ncbi:hypothetical protein QR680_006499 [Steinernema hermaphroditum]|uniref:Uncharacterized protein n=1 Tax=Steinernema hermaphroditum TaxID=289476 RepID=A0AA39HY24_9BILA|nr:hypothetical protein QR680_006499 [Steinernema hermaphroditum]
MRLLLFLLFLAIATTEAVVSSSPTARVRCSEFLVCSEQDRKTFEKRREMAMILARFHEEIKWSGYVRKAELLYEAKKHRADLCSDITTTGFMLEEGAQKWPMACIWNGAINGTESCAPYPFKEESVFELRDAQKWRQAVANFRRAIGCSDVEIFNTRNVEENYFCRERCVQLGIGYVPQIIILASVMLTMYLAVK